MTTESETAGLLQPLECLLVFINLLYVLYIYEYRWTCGRLLSLFFTSFLRPFDCPRKVLVSLVNYPARLSNHHIQIPKKEIIFLGQSP